MPELRIDLDAHPGRVKVLLRSAMATCTELARRLDPEGARDGCEGGARRRSARLGGMHQPGGEVLADDVTQLLPFGPDQWLIVSEHRPARELIAHCERVLGDLRHHAVDLSAALTCARLSEGPTESAGLPGEARDIAHGESDASHSSFSEGSPARALLAMGSGLDWYSREVQPGFCTRLRLARVPVIVHMCARDTFDLYYDRSYRAYMEQWFAHARRDPMIGSAAGA